MHERCCFYYESVLSFLFCTHVYIQQLSRENNQTAHLPLSHNNDKNVILDTPAVFTISEILIFSYSFLSIKTNTASPIHIRVNRVRLLCSLENKLTTILYLQNKYSLCSPYFYFSIAHFSLIMKVKILLHLLHIQDDHISTHLLRRKQDHFLHRP